MRNVGQQENFSFVSSMSRNLPWNGGYRLQPRQASSYTLQGDKERGDRVPATGQSAADAASKKNVTRPPARLHGVTRNPSHPGAFCKTTQQGARQQNSAPLERHWTENHLDVHLGTCCSIDHRQNFRAQPFESINTSAAHVLERASES